MRLWISGSKSNLLGRPCLVFPFISFTPQGDKKFSSSWNREKVYGSDLWVDFCAECRWGVQDSIFPNSAWPLPNCWLVVMEQGVPLWLVMFTYILLQKYTQLQRYLPLVLSLIEAISSYSTFITNQNLWTDWSQRLNLCKCSCWTRCQAYQLYHPWRCWDHGMSSYIRHYKKNG